MEPEFYQLKQELTGKLEKTIRNYIEALGVKFSPEKLRQMSQPLDEIAAEVLMFGGDQWPRVARPGGEKGSNIAKFERSSSPKVAEGISKVANGSWSSVFCLFSMVSWMM